MVYYWCVWKKRFFVQLLGFFFFIDLFNKKFFYEYNYKYNFIVVKYFIVMYYYIMFFGYKKNE